MSDRPVSDAIVREMLENANWAPTHGMTEPWRFVVFRGAARSRVAEFLQATYQRVTPPEDFRQKKLESLGTNPLRAPVLISIGMQRQVSGRISEIDEIAAVACAVQNMHLTATACGVGAFWSSNAAVCSDAMREWANRIVSWVCCMWATRRVHGRRVRGRQSKTRCSGVLSKRVVARRGCAV